MDDDTRLSGPVAEDPHARREAERRRNTLLLIALAAVVCVAGAVLAVNALTGGGATDAGSAGAGAPNATVPTDGAVPPSDLVAFTSPSGNIGCVLSSESARCDVQDRSWDVPPKPVSCEGDWGVGMFVGPESSGMVCATDTALGQGDPLAYGSTLERGAYTCASSEDGMRCENTQTGRGFTVARASYTTF